MEPLLLPWNADIPSFSEDVIEKVEALIQLWTFAIYFQHKPKSMQQILTENNYPESVISGFFNVYLGEKLVDVIERISSHTSSGIPRVLNTEWLSQTIISRNGCPGSEPQITLTIETNQGQKQLQLSEKQIKKLYYATNDVQNSLDNLLKR
ncbi:unnamed protein product [Caenorhabditis bovis]|uniref:COMM domain-containing protein n=1 Tax=Caenorhabditis bovis TaxID=2654633 RepID=A0A8S1DZ46_9PELO|nr:unnamed protein product [Caenorhabditis bovis]